MSLLKLPSRSVDYVFTDPPYDASIQYGELSYMWAAWLKMDTGYIETISAKEVIRNERQHKDFDVYHGLLKNSFEGMHKALKLGRYLTVTFHNPTFQVRNATIRAGTYVGFELEKIHHQPLARGSGKSLLQPFGSAQGDFYLRFTNHNRKHLASKHRKKLMRSVLKRSLLILQSNCWRKEPNQLHTQLLSILSILSWQSKDTSPICIPDWMSNGVEKPHRPRV